MHGEEDFVQAQDVVGGADWFRAVSDVGASSPAKNEKDGRACYCSCNCRK